MAAVGATLRPVEPDPRTYNIDPARIGVIGFSAGGELATLAGTQFDAGNPNAADPVDRLSSRPAFMGLIYPYVGRIFPASLTLTKDTPPAFLLGGEKDEVSQPLPALYLTLEKAGVPAELHMLTGVGHGFGVRATNPPHVAAWTTLFANWLDAQGYLKSK